MDISLSLRGIIQIPPIMRVGGVGMVVRERVIHCLRIDDCVEVVIRLVRLAVCDRVAFCGGGDCGAGKDFRARGDG